MLEIKQILTKLRASKHYVLLTIILALFAFAEVRLIPLREFGDESETLVTALLIGDHKILYSEIFNHHGPATFVPDIALHAMGFQGLVASRLPVLGLKLAWLLALFSFLKFRPASQRLGIVASSALLLFAGTVCSLINTGVYQVYAGLLMAFAVVWLVLPNLMPESRNSKVTTVLGAAFATILPAFAIWYLPVSALLLAAAYTKARRFDLLTGLAISACATLLIFSSYADFRGYVTDHVLLNALVMPSYRPANETFFLATPLESVIYVAVPVALVFASLMAARNMSRRARVSALLLLGSLLAVYIRGVSFHAMPAYLASIALLALVGPLGISRLYSTIKRTQAGWPKQQIISVTLPTCALVMSVWLVCLSPAGLRWQKSQEIAEETGFSRVVMAVTDPRDRVLVYPFNSYEYVRSNRLPASGNFFFLPWQADPQLLSFPSSPIDTCRDLASNPPKVIGVEDNGLVWFGSTWSQYSGCIGSYVKANYREVAEDTYLRNDLTYSAGKHNK